MKSMQQTLEKYIMRILVGKSEGNYYFEGLDIGGSLVLLHLKEIVV
jgi:hypothetical protein